MSTSPRRRRSTRGPQKRPSDRSELAPTGIEGLDTVLGGGLPRRQLCVVQGDPGAGKTTLALQFALAGARSGERVLYVTTSESEEEIEALAHSHGWELGDLHVRSLDLRTLLIDEDTGQSVFHPAELELPRTMEALISVIDAVSPERLVLDSLTELRLMAGEPRWFRRQVLALKDDLRARACTTLLCDDRLGTGEPVLSLVHGVMELSQTAQAYGADRRRLRVSKIRGRAFTTGYHDMQIHTGGIQVYPRLLPESVPAAPREVGVLPSGLPELDTLLGGGIDEGTSTLLLGPAGTGKSLVAAQLALAVAGRGQRTAFYLFDEDVATLLKRTSGLGMDLRGAKSRDRIELIPMSPAATTPGEFAHTVRSAVLEGGVRMVVIDSLAGYLEAVGDEGLLSVHLHEIIRFLGHHGAALVLLMAQRGLPGSPAETPLDLSYLSDTVVLLRHFAYAGEMRKAISIYKRRGGRHEATIRELKIGPRGLRVGEPLSRFHGILTGVPRFVGEELPHVAARSGSQQPT